MSELAVEWRWWLCETDTLEQIAELEVHSKQMQPQLNSPGTATGWVHLLDPNCGLILPHNVAIRTDRNNIPQWSGPVFKTSESTAAGGTGAQSGQDTCNFTAMGWLQVLNQRIVHTGSEFVAMLDAPNGIAWQEVNGTYDGPGVDGSVSGTPQISYSATEDPSITDAVIIFDLLDRANIDCPTGITRGTVYGNPVQRNFTVQQFQNVWTEIQTLINVEAGCDIYIDPVTRQMDLYGPGASPSPNIPNGLGNDRGPGTLFSLPGNCIAATRTRDGTMTTNRLEVVGQYAAGRADDLASQASYGVFEASDSLSDVTDTNILIAYANEEVAVRGQPWTIISFTPRGLTMDDINAGAAGVPMPYDDYTIGDIVYCSIQRGSFQVGQPLEPQATRVFGWTLNIDDANSVEKLTSIQTTYQGAASS